MSWQGTSWAAGIRTGNPILKALLLVLANFANEDGECWYSQKRISFDSEIPERTLRRKLSELVDMGLIEVEERRREDGSRLNNLVRLRMPPATMAGCDGPDPSPPSKRPKTGGTSGQNPGAQSATIVAADKESIRSQELGLSYAREPDKPDDGWPEDYLDQFWKAFPPFRREGKRKVGEKLARLRRDKAVAWDALIEAVRKFAATDPGQYAPAPLVWLNGERWDREYGQGGPNGGRRDQPSRTGAGFAALRARLRRSGGGGDEPPASSEPHG